MKNVVSYLGKALLCCAVSLISFNSCQSIINEDYDLSKDVDLNATVLQGVSAVECCATCGEGAYHDANQHQRNNSRPILSHSFSSVLLLQNRSL